MCTHLFKMLNRNSCLVGATLFLSSRGRWRKAIVPLRSAFCPSTVSFRSVDFNDILSNSSFPSFKHAFNAFNQDSDKRSFKGKQINPYTLYFHLNFKPFVLVLMLLFFILVFSFRCVTSLFCLILSIIEIFHYCVIVSQTNGPCSGCRGVASWLPALLLYFIITCVPQGYNWHHAQSLHTGCQLLAADKTLLMKLRKSTGYTFINCKEALEKFDNDVTQVILLSLTSSLLLCCSLTKKWIKTRFPFRLKAGCMSRLRRRAGTKQTSWKVEKPKRAWSVCL